MKASLGSVEYITSQFISKAESQKINDAVIKSSYGTDLVRAALSVNNKKVKLNFKNLITFDDSLSYVSGRRLNLIGLYLMCR